MWMLILKLVLMVMFHLIGNPPVSMPISFKVGKSQSEEAKQIVKLVKKYYLC